MKKFLLIILMLFSILFIASCKEKEKDYTIYEGMVVDKIFESGYSYVTYVQSGKTRIPITHYVPDSYYIIIYKDEKIAKHKVTKSFYETFDIGSFITVGEENIDWSDEDDN